MPANQFAVNGLVELLPLNNDFLLSMERSFSVGAPDTGNTIKLFDVSLAGADDVNGFDSIALLLGNRAAEKTLLLDLDALGIPLDNIEGMTLGPNLPDGRRSLDPRQRQQLLSGRVHAVPALRCRPRHCPETALDSPSWSGRQSRSSSATSRTRRRSASNSTRRRSGRVWSRYHETARTVLERHGGTIEKFVGDAVLAVFGIPVVHEDDALRAVRAAVELRGELARLNDELERAFGIRIGVRTGVHTGEVFAGDPIQGDPFATGDAVVVAQRLEATATAGEILVGDADDPPRPRRRHRRADAAAGAEGQGRAGRRLACCSTSSPTARGWPGGWIRRSSGAQPSSKRCSRSSSAPLPTARAGSSRSSASRASASRASRRSWSRPRARTRSCSRAGASRTATGSRTGRSSRSCATSTSTRILGGEPDGATAHARILEAVGRAEPRSRSDELYWAIRRLLETLARERPVVLVLDDIQWAEPAFLDLVEYLAGWSRDAPILVCCLARPDLAELRPAWGGTTMELAPLPRDHARTLLENLAGPLDPETADAVGRATGGNPLFLEEMLRMLVEDGVLVEREGTLVPLDSVDSLRVPGTVQAVLAARLDRLAEDELAVLQRAAVIGQVFWWGAVADLSPPEEVGEVAGRLQALVRKGLIKPDARTFAGEDGFRFGHILIRDAAYESMPKRLRAELHERFAGWAEERARGVRAGRDRRPPPRAGVRRCASSSGRRARRGGARGPSGGRLARAAAARSPAATRTPPRACSAGPRPCAERRSCSSTSLRRRSDRARDEAERRRSRGRGAEAARRRAKRGRGHGSASG